MNINNFTIKSQEAIQMAQQIAQGMQHQQIENEHLFKAVLEVDENVLPFILKKLNVNFPLIKQILESELNNFPKVSGGDLMFSQQSGKTINEAAIIAKKMKDEFVSIEHLVLAIFKSKSKIAQILKDQGVTESDLEAAIKELRKGGKVTSQRVENTVDHQSKLPVVGLEYHDVHNIVVVALGVEAVYAVELILEEYEGKHVAAQAIHRGAV